MEFVGIVPFVGAGGVNYDGDFAVGAGAELVNTRVDLGLGEAEEGDESREEEKRVHGGGWRD